METKILDLLQNNQNCRLPCWWGFIPGQTNWRSVREFFLANGNNIFESKDLSISDNGIFSGGLTIAEHDFHVGADFFVETGIIKVINVISDTSSPPDTIKYGDPFYLNAMNNYTLSEILSSQGRPKQVLLSINPNKYISYPDYFLLVYFPDTGILAEYDGRSEEVGTNLQLCPRNTLIGIWLWSPTEKLSLEDVYSSNAEVRKEDSINRLKKFLSWEKISGKSIDDFVKTFKNENACFDTPAALWGRK
jgi:hypothetical protein